MENKLSIIIPTYNRKNRLITQLKSIFIQTQYNQVNIILLDNCSDYNLYTTLKENFKEEEFSILTIITRQFNIGMLGNVSSSFVNCETKWMWLLSDDDVTTENSILKILEYIDKYPDILTFKFTHIRQFQKINYAEIDVKNISELLDCCNNHGIDLGNLIFMSNNVFNIEKLKPYLSSAFTYSYTYFPHIIPVLLGLNSEHNKVKFISYSVVKYNSPENAMTSDHLVSLYLGASTIVDIPFNLNKKDFNRLALFFEMNSFWKISKDFYSSSFSQKIYLYEKIYYNTSKISWNLSNWIIYNIFKFQMFIKHDFISHFFDRVKK